jgi:hypothetical protein
MLNFGNIQEPFKTLKKACCILPIGQVMQTDPQDIEARIGCPATPLSLIFNRTTNLSRKKAIYRLIIVSST